MIRTFLLAVALAAASLSACSQPCDSNHRCAINDTQEVCDGETWTACTAGNANQRIECVRTPRTAVCTTAGWTFENVPQ